MTARTTTRREILFASDRFLVGTFRCETSDPLWEHENSIDDGFNMVFPSAPVRIARPGGGAVLADRNQVMLYDHGEKYRREAASRDGDVCLFVVPDEDVLRAAGAATGIERDTGRFRFPLRAVPASARTYLLSRAIAHRLRAGTIDRAEAETYLAEIATTVVGDVARIARAQGGHGPVLRAGQVDLVEAAKLMLAEFPSAPRVTEIAEALAVSQFHLARIFRRHTGFSLHGYRDQLRLRFCLDQLVAGAASISELSYSAGYSSPSHFSDTFRRKFGFPPSRAVEVVMRHDMASLPRPT